MNKLLISLLVLIIIGCRGVNKQVPLQKDLILEPELVCITPEGVKIYRAAHASTIIYIAVGENDGRNVSISVK